MFIWRNFCCSCIVLVLTVCLSVAIKYNPINNNGGECHNQQPVIVDNNNKNNINRDISLTCSLKTIDKSLKLINLTSSSLSSDSVSKLSVMCSDVYFFESFITPSTFSGFLRVQDLNIEYCKIRELNDSSFSNLKNLRNLTFQTRNVDWPVMSMSISPQLFRPLRQLERLDLSTNKIWELPGGTFCSLMNLKVLNLSVNHLQDLTQLGFGGSVPALANRNSSCRSEITLLDLSFNDVDVLVSGALKGLGHLQELFLQNNQLGKLDDDAFEGLGSLTTLDISHNRLVALPENAFQHTSQLMYFIAKNNSLSILAPGLFQGLEYLVELNLAHNELKSEYLTETSFQGLIRLMQLDLSFNKITQINSQVFRDMYVVQVLKLHNNQIASVSDSAFGSCVNLHKLDLSYNQIKTVTSKSFHGANVLSYLALDNNQIAEVDPVAFVNLTSIEDLNIHGNNLKIIPIALKHLRYLKTLDLGDNEITSLENLPVRGLQFLYGLRLVNNKITGNISKDTFNNLPSLKILNLAKNGITFIEQGAFDKNQNLQAIRLDANLLSSMNNLFENLQNLEWLNVSDNNIEVFDYHYIPQSLLWLDMHKNKIFDLGNFLERHDLRLETLDASFNKIKHISSIQIPDSVELVFLNDNRLSKVEPFTFFKKENLTRVDLFSNNLSKMEKSALRISVGNRPLPEFSLGGNSFVCDCTMEWLQEINMENNRNHPAIVDMENIYCQMSFSRSGTFLPLAEVSPSQFLCQYEAHCFALCHCCEFDACDCEMTCPEGCGCYHDHSWSSNIVDCSYHEIQSVPYRIPMDATEVYLDGNYFKNLSSHSFIGRKNLQILYVNGSKVETLDNETFSGLTKLTVLHLEDNFIEALRGHEFKGLDLLRELFLHNNKLSYIHQHTFATLSHLEVLTLHNNQLINFPVWRLADNPYLISVALRNNHWTCECQFVESFDIWLSGNIRKVADADEIKCYSNDIENPGSYILEFNVTTCLNTSSTSTVIQPMILDSLLHPAIAISVAFVVLIVLVLCFLYRNTIRVRVYSQCGLRMCHNGHADDRDKLYDAFVSYSSKDEAWVNQVLAGELERGEKPYKVCLHYRDFPVTAYIAETIVEAVESSRRTIIVLSKNFIENEWCRFQFKSAHHEVLKKKRKKLIVIVLGEIPARDLDPDLRLYLKTNTCIHSGDKLFWEKLKFAMPDITNAQRIVHTYSTIPERSTINKYTVNSQAATLHHLNHHHHHQNSSDAYWA